MAHHDKKQFNKLAKIFKKYRKEEKRNITLSISEIEKLIGKKLPSVSKSKYSIETLWNNYSEPSTLWKDNDYKLIKFDHETQEIKFKLDFEVTFNQLRELDNEESAFKRLHILEIEEAIEEYMTSEPTAEHYQYTDLYNNDFWVDTKRVAIGGIEEAARTLKYSKGLGCNPVYNDILYECLSNFPTQKLRKECFFKRITESFPGENITHKEFIEIEKFFREELLSKGVLEKEVFLKAIFNHKADNYFNLCQSKYKNEINRLREAIKIKKENKKEKTKGKIKEFFILIIFLISIAFGVYLIGQMNESFKSMLKDDSVCTKLGLKSNWNGTKCY